MKQIDSAKFKNGSNNFVINFSDEGRIINIPATTDTALAVPNSARIAVFGISSSANIIISESAITAPSGSFANSTGIVNPGAIILTDSPSGAIRELRFFTDAEAWVSVSFYA